MVRLWDATKGVELQTLKGHSGSVRSVAFSPDGEQVVSGSWDRTVRLWGATKGVEPQTLGSHSDHVNSVAFSPDGKLVVSGSSDGTVQLWDAVNRVALQSHSHTSQVTSVAFSPNSKQVVFGSIDKTVGLWDAFTGVPLQKLEGQETVLEKEYPDTRSTVDLTPSLDSKDKYAEVDKTNRQTRGLRKEIPNNGHPK
jgi:WD40 repeat protein